MTKQPDNLADLRRAFSRGEIDGITYKAVRRALIAAIATGALPPSPLRPIVATPVAPGGKPVREIPPEMLATRMGTAEVPQAPRPTAREPAASPAPVRTPKPVEMPSTPTRQARAPSNNLAVIVLAVTLVVGATAGIYFFRSSVPTERVALVPTATATIAVASREALALQKFAVDDDWSSEAIDNATRALAGFGVADRDSVAGRGLLERLRHAVSQRIDQERELNSSGNRDASRVESLAKLGSALAVEDEQIKALLAIATSPTQAPDDKRPELAAATSEIARPAAMPVSIPQAPPLGSWSAMSGQPTPRNMPPRTRTPC